jgi:trigger factor
MAEVEAVVVENNVANHVLERAKATPKSVPFDELMAG